MNKQRILAIDTSSVVAAAAREIASRGEAEALPSTMAPAKAPDRHRALQAELRSLGQRQTRVVHAPTVIQEFEGKPVRVSTKPYVAPKVPGRNDPSPCGSGKKFKKCHGATA